MRRFQAAQGDFLIEKISKQDYERLLIRPNSKPMKPDPDGRIVLAKSEVRGHEHCFIDPRVVLTMTPSAEGFLVYAANVLEASRENPVLLLGGNREAQRARLNGEPVTDTVLPGEGHFPIPITEPGYYHIPQQVERDLLGNLRQVTD